jgi:ribosomal-protein-alanine N-acetyltransferase
VEWHPPEPRLETEGIALRPFRVDDAAAVVDACRDPAILRFTFMQDGLTEDAAVEWIVRSNNRWPDGSPRFAIVHPDDDRLLGQVGLNVNVRHVSAEGHYWVKASDRQRGVASRALGLVADWGFSNGIQRLFLVIHPENVASNRLAERMGFTREGVLRSYEPVKSQRPDLVSWSLLPADPRPWHQQTSRSGPMP